MKSESLMHGKDWSGQRLGGWLVQEKLDGLRCLWTGSELVSRNGERFNAPAWFTAGLPPGIALDGELYAGAGSLGRISNTLARHKSGADADWTGIRFMVFDAPEVCGPFSKRAAFIRGIDAMHTTIVPTTIVQYLASLRRELKALHKRGGEGFILRDPSARYIAGRTDRLLKFKGAHLY
jgi:DNA ligase 1